MNQEPIAIIGLSCRFPQAKDTKQFYQLLSHGMDGIIESSRNSENPDVKDWGGFLDNIDRFATEFFKIPPQEAKLIDPQQRLLLEIAWNALEDAGQIPKNLSGTKTGVFIGIASSDYSQLMSDYGFDDLNVTIGNQRGMAANRISYSLDLRGVSLAIDTACSSALVAVDRACRSLWTGESTLALVGGVNLTLAKNGTARFAQAGLIAADGRCKVFDASADGYVRSEGVGMVVLKPLSEAQAQRDRVYALIKESAVNQDGRSNGLTAPNLQAQVELLQDAYAQANVDPATVQYIETHATGTAIGDALELKAIGKVLGNNRCSDFPCCIGSVKTNIGHAEAASGMAGLIKVIFSLYHRRLFPNLHFKQPNPSVNFETLGLQVQQTLESLPKTEQPLRMGVSAFGFGGTNAHVILEEAPSPKPIDSIAVPFHILTLSAQTETALQTLVKCYLELLSQHPEINLGNLCYSANTARSCFSYRLFTIATSLQELADNLRQFTNNETSSNVFTQKINRPYKIDTESILQEMIESDRTISIAHKTPQLWHQTLTKLGNFWLQGYKVDWSLIYAKDNYQLLSLPTYPFEHQSYWFDRNLPSGKSSKIITDALVLPHNSIEEKLTRIWENLLNINPIGVEDNFFDLGGSSVLTARLVDQVEAVFNKKLPLVALFELTTISQLAYYIENQETYENLPQTQQFFDSLKYQKYELSSKQERKLLAIMAGRKGERPHARSLMVKINVDTLEKKPFFYCANGYKEALSLAESLEHPFYLMESGYMVFENDSAYSIKAIATRHVEDMLEVQPEGSYSIGGYSYGTLVAYEIAQQLQARGKTVDVLVIFDRPGNDFWYQLYRYGKRLPFHLQSISDHLQTLGIQTRFQYLQQKGLRILRKLGLIPSQLKPHASQTLEMKSVYQETTSTPKQASISSFPMFATSPYQFTPYENRVVLFLAEEERKNRAPLWLFPRSGWGKGMLPRLEVYPVPGTHFTMIHPPHVTALAQKLTACLEGSK